MTRRPFLIFAAVVFSLVGGSVLFLQSRTFAGMVRGFLSETVPAELGVSLEFTDFQLRLFPPGVSVRNPEVRLDEKNVLQLPQSSLLKASRLDLQFRPFQVLSGRIRVEQLRLVEADVSLDLRKAPVGGSMGLRWKELIEVRVQSVALEHSRVRLVLPDSLPQLDLSVDSAALLRLEDPSRPPFSFTASLGRSSLAWKKGSGSVGSLILEADLGPSGMQVRSAQVRLDHGDSSSVVGIAGKIEGDPLNPRSLQSRIGLDVQGDSAQMLAWLAGLERVGGLRPFVRTESSPVSGRVSLKGVLSGDLLKLDRSASFDGRLQMEDAKLWGWSVQRLETAARLASGEGEASARLELRSASISGAPVAGTSGGTLKVSKLDLPLGPWLAAEALVVPVELEAAPLRWLLGPHASSVDNLDVSFSGKVEASLVGGRRPVVRAKLDLSSPSLQVLSGEARAGSRRPRVLKTVPFRLNGDIEIADGKFVPGDLSWKFGKTDLQVSGQVDWSGERMLWGLEARGPVDLSDLRELGGSPIQGRGRLQASVHGPEDALVVDMDADLSNSSYINLMFGGLRGRFSLVDGQSVLRFQGVEGKQGDTAYRVSGPIDFRGDGSLDLAVDFPGGRVEDFLAVFEPLTRSLNWFPQSLQGRISAKGRVHGGLGLDRLLVETTIRGRDWSFFGERFRDVQFQGGYERGTYRMAGMRAKKRSGQMLGDVSFDSQGRFDWKFKTRDFQLRDLDWMLRLNIPIRGALNVASEGSGTLDELESVTQISLEETQVRSRAYPRSSLRLGSQKGVWSATGRGLGQQVQLDWKHDRRASALNHLRVAISSADFTPVLLLLNPTGIQDASLRGVASGSVDLSYPGNEIDRATGTIALDEFSATKEGASLALDAPALGKMLRGDLSMSEVRFRGDRGAVTRLSLASREGFWRSSLRGELELTVLEFLSPLIQQSSGLAVLDLALAGPILEPSVSGTVELKAGSVRTTLLESPFENLRGKILIRDGRVTLSGFQSDLAQGLASASGQVQFFINRFPSVDLTLALNENRLKFPPFQFLKVRNARLKVSGDSLPYDVTGSIAVERALSREKLSSAGRGLSLQSSLYAPPPSGDVAFDFPKFRLGIDVSAPGGIQFQNELLDIEVRADLKVVNTVEAPRLLGRAEMVAGQGKLTFKDHVFQVQSAQVRFDNPAVINPVFDLVATTEISGTKVQLYTSGTSDRFKVELSSNPVLPEAEILSLLAMGRTLEESQRLRAGSTAGVQQSEAASLILHSLDFNRDVREKTGFQLGVGEAMDPTTGMSAFRPQGDADSLVAPKIVLKRQIGKRIDVSVGSTVGAGTTNQREVNADFYLSPNVSVRGVWNFWEGSTSQDTSTSVLQQSRTSYGVDFKLQKRFK